MLRYFQKYIENNNTYEFIGIDLNTKVLDLGRKFDDEIKYTIMMQHYISFHKIQF